VDTVEWGSGRDPVESLTRQRDSEPDESATQRRLGRIGGWWTAVTLAAAGLAAMMASELLPWTTLHFSSQGTNTDSNPLGPTGTLSLGLDRLQTFEVFGYEFAMLAMFALLGSLLFGSGRQRRAVFGMGVGLVAAQALTLAGMIHSFGHLLDSYLGLDRATTGLHTTIGPGAYFAVIGLILLLAALLMTAAPERVRAQLSDVMREPVDAEFTDEPIELTVTQAKPIDESYFTRPDNHHR
jgi:hypothetical protein